MFNPISGINGSYGPYMYGRYSGVAAAGGSPQVKGAQGAQGVAALGAYRAAQPETPVEPVRPVTAVKGATDADINRGLLMRHASDPAEMAVRMRIQYGGEPSGVQAAEGMAAGKAAVPPSLAPAGAQAASGAQVPEQPGKGEALGAEGVQKAAEEGQCDTCEQRKYQDGSDDPGVSFKTPTRMSPDQAASAVRGHEQEHVVREQAKAAREDRRVVSQSVRLHTDICPECGRVYVSGGVTETVTASKPQQSETAVPADEIRGFAGFEGVA